MNTTDVLALPTDLHPVALAASYGLHTRDWGVVADRDGRPELVAAGLPSGVAAQRRAGTLPGTVYLVYRCAHAVTVHTRDYSHPGNTLGTLPVAGDGGTPADAWAHVVNASTGDPVRDADHHAMITEALRVVHRLPTGTAPVVIAATAMADPRPRGVYLAAYVRQLSGPAALHRHAALRTVAQHLPADLVDPHVRELNAELAAPYRH